jgi:putative sigma-54 modulation protein
VNITINARHMEVTEAIKTYVQSKADKLPRYLDSIQSVVVTLDIDADESLVEFIVQARRKHTFVAHHRGENMYASIDACISKITEQLRRHKSRTREHQGPGLPEGMVETAEE